MRLSRAGRPRARPAASIVLDPRYDPEQVLGSVERGLRARATQAASSA
jgi:hypothetical protein